MQYYIAKTVSGGFSATVERVIESLKAEGFGVLTEAAARVNDFRPVIEGQGPTGWKLFAAHCSEAEPHAQL